MAYNVQIKLNDEQEKKLKAIADLEIRTAPAQATWVLLQYLQGKLVHNTSMDTNVIKVEESIKEEESIKVEEKNTPEPSKKVTIKNMLDAK